jgi:rod shape-determining protein MreC
MENFFTRYKNPLVLMAVLFIQVIALATQVKRQENPRAGGGGGGTRLIRVWTITAFTPIEKMFVSTGHFFRDSWHTYGDLRGIRKQNHDLQEQIERLQMEQARLRQDADQAHRLQALLEFKEKFAARTLAAQVIGTSGTEQSRVLIIDKGAHDGIKIDMAVITPDGIVGKIKDVFPLSSQVLLINDHESGAGAILESSRLQGVLKGTSTGELQITDIMSDEKIEAGEHVITSGGDRIFPKGLSVGTVISASPDRDNDPFMNIRVKPTADLRRLEEVLVITKMAEETPAVAAGSSLRAADILSQRLPSVPKIDPNASKTPGAAASPTPGAGASPTPAAPNKPAAAAPKKDATEPKKDGAAAAPAVKPPSGAQETGTAKPPSAAARPAATPGKTGALTATPGGTASAGTISGAGAGQKPEKKKSAGTAGQGAAGAETSHISSNQGSPTPTPTPKPKAPAKKKAPATPDASPETPDNRPPEASPTPTPAQERPR